ncbi:MAG: PhnD/SsuA/transferrin family substrate-binding protein, partial [Chloroflexi bacterium]|nr:PhnD/SsuA/transferrin family substrate-binding protein [Chloroflexota bacterium]
VPATPTPEAPALGSEERPIPILFVPSVEAAVITTGGEVMADFLNEATGLFFTVSVPTSYAATIEEMCASGGDAMGFIPALGYVLANQRCGVEVGAAAIRRGLSWYTSMIVVRRDSEFAELADLDGATWCYPDSASTSGFLYPTSMFIEAGIEPVPAIGEGCGGHGGVITALLTDESVNFGTAFFSPPALSEGTWQYGDDPEPYNLEDDVFKSEEGSVFVGDVEVLDARILAFDADPEVINKLRILALSPQIPNDTLSFAPGFPEDLRSQIIDALVAFSQTEEWGQSIGQQAFYGWSGLEPVDDSFYAPVYALITNLGYTEEDILG